MYGYRWTARSLRQSCDVSDWWRRNRPLARLLFDDELDRAIDLACRHPDAGESVVVRGLRGARRLVLPKTGYLLIYRFDEEAQKVVVEQIRSGKRRPAHRRTG